MTPEHDQRITEMAAKRRAEIEAHCRDIDRQIALHEGQEAWIVQIETDQLPVYVDPTDSGVFNVLFARAMPKSEAEKLARVTRNGKGTRGEAVPYIQALEQAKATSLEIADNYEANMRELIALSEETK